MKKTICLIIAALIVFVTMAASCSSKSTSERVPWYESLPAHFELSSPVEFVTPYLRLPKVYNIPNHALPEKRLDRDLLSSYSLIGSLRSNSIVNQDSFVIDLSYFQPSYITAEDSCVYTHKEFGEQLLVVLSKDHLQAELYYDGNLDLSELPLAFFYDGNPAGSQEELCQTLLAVHLQKTPCEKKAVLCENSHNVTVALKSFPGISYEFFFGIVGENQYYLRNIFSNCMTIFDNFP